MLAHYHCSGSALHHCVTSETGSTISQLCDPRAKLANKPHCPDQEMRDSSSTVLTPSGVPPSHCAATEVRIAVEYSSAFPFRVSHGTGAANCYIAYGEDMSSRQPVLAFCKTNSSYVVEPRDAVTPLTDQTRHPSRLVNDTALALFALANLRTALAYIPAVPTNDTTALAANQTNGGWTIQLQWQPQGIFADAVSQQLRADNTTTLAVVRGCSSG